MKAASVVTEALSFRPEKRFPAGRGRGPFFWAAICMAFSVEFGNDAHLTAMSSAIRRSSRAPFLL